MPALLFAPVPVLVIYALWLALYLFLAVVFGLAACYLRPALCNLPLVRKWCCVNIGKYGNAVNMIKI